VRATWDYHESPDAYRAWLGRLDPRRTFNPPDLIRWNLAKTHVLDLGRRGAPVPRSIETDASPSAIAGALETLGLRDAVIKPLIGASGFGVERVTRGEERAALAPAIVAQMREILALLPERPLYARVDGVADGARFVVMEIEVNEPGLGMHLAPGAGDRFAEALLARP
jgi:hypothetical protein